MAKTADNKAERNVNGNLERVMRLWVINSFKENNFFMGLDLMLKPGELPFGVVPAVLFHFINGKI